MTSQVRPLKNFILVESLGEEVTETGIILPETYGKEGKFIKKGKVIDIGPDVERIGSGSITGFNIGSVVYYLQKSTHYSELSDKKMLIRNDQIIGVDNSEKLPTVDYTDSIFPLSKWEDFKGEHFTLWKDYSNINEFQFRVNFLYHFQNLDNLSKVIYESCTQGLIQKTDLSGSEVEINKTKEDYYVIDVEHDVFDCAILLKNSGINFIKKRTNMENLCRTLPTLLSIFSHILASAHFSFCLGKNYNRVTSTSFCFGQRVQLTGKGKQGEQKVTNAELMKQLINIKGPSESKKATLEYLGVEFDSVGRTDLSLIFDRKINEHEYKVSLEIRAPKNEDSSLLSIDWIITDHLPGVLHEREYAPVFEHFFKNIVLNSFYKKWFENVYCTTLR